MARRTTRALAIATEVGLPLVIAVLVTGALHGERSVPRALAQRHLNTPAIASASVSSDGRFVAFESLARLVATDTNPVSDIYVQNIDSGRLELVSVGADGTASKDSSSTPRLSGDGRYVAFVSTATNLAPGDTNERPDVYAYDLNSESIELLSRTRSGKAGNGASSRPAISETGRFVAFDSTASDLICTRSCASRDQDHNLVSDVFLLDRERGRIRRLSQELTGQPWWEPSVGPALDAAARRVTFSSRHAGDSGDLRADFDLFILNIKNH